MKVTHKSKQQLMLQNALFTLLFMALIAMLAWLSSQYRFQTDWTANNLHTLSPASSALVNQLHEPVTVKAFATEDTSVRKAITDVLARYQRQKPDIQLSFVNPDINPDQVREHNITMDGELVIEYQGRTEKLSTWDEQSITNVLQRLSRADERWVVFLEGHGERSPFKQANHDLQLWAQELKSKGFKILGLNLATDPEIPANTTMVVIAGPQVAYLPGEITLLSAYLRRGGNLLWLIDPEKGVDPLEPLAEQLGIELDPGVIVDPTTQMYKINNPTFAIVGDYGSHAIVQAFDVLTVFPRAAGLRIEPQDDWLGQGFLLTNERSWSETGVLAGEIEFDFRDDVPGPLVIGVAAERKVSVNEHEEIQRTQRVVAVGDGDFLSNAYLGNGGNLDLGMNMINWLSRDDQLISIPSKTAVDSSLMLTSNQSMLLGMVFMLLMPLLMLGAGLGIWFKRRRA